MAQQIKHYMDEPDIGSGEKNAAQREIEREETALGKSENQNDLSTSGEQPDIPGRILRSGTHLARILALRQPDDTYEAQVYVRLTREPQIAETYIPAGTFPTEHEAWVAAEQRAMRAFKEQEF